MRFFSVLVVAGVFCSPSFALADTYTQENFLFSYHYKPVTFSLVTGGGFTGTLENGTTFNQVPVVTESSIRLHKFIVGEAYFYVSDQGTFQASDNLVALSIYSYLTAS